MISLVFFHNIIQVSETSGFCKFFIFVITEDPLLDGATISVELRNTAGSKEEEPYVHFSKAVWPLHC